jgi:hypothetical protein
MMQANLLRFAAGSSPRTDSLVGHGRPAPGWPGGHLPQVLISVIGP